MRTTASGAISRSAIPITTWRTWTVGFTAGTSIIRPLASPVSASSASWSTVLPPNRGRWRAAMSSGGPAAPFTSCVGRTSFKGPNGCASRSATRIQAWCWRVKNLTPVLDYDIDYLQGRLLLTQPLASTADDSLLVHSDSTGGNPVFLVVRYEYHARGRGPGCDGVWRPGPLLARRPCQGRRDHQPGRGRGK